MPRPPSVAQLLAYPGLPDTACRIACAIAMRSDPEGECPAGYLEIAAAAGRGEAGGSRAAAEKSVQRAVRALEKLGLLGRVDPVAGRHGGRQFLRWTGRHASTLPDTGGPPDATRPPDTPRPPHRTPGVHLTGHATSTGHDGEGGGMGGVGVQGSNSRSGTEQPGAVDTARKDEEHDGREEQGRADNRGGSAGLGRDSGDQEQGGDRPDREGGPVTPPLPVRSAVPDLGATSGRDRGGTEAFALAPPEPAPKRRRARGSAPKPGCSDEHWRATLAAWALCGSIAGRTKGWGAFKDTPTNRKHAGRIFAEGYSVEDLQTVMRYLGEGMRDGTHDPHWTSLDHVARSMEKYLHQARSGSRPRPRRARGAVSYEPVTELAPGWEQEIEDRFRQAGQ